MYAQRYIKSSEYAASISAPELYYEKPSTNFAEARPDSFAHPSTVNNVIKAKVPIPRMPYLRHDMGGLSSLVGENREGVPCRDRILAAAAGHHSGQHLCVTRQLWTSPYRREDGRRYFETILKRLQSLGKPRNNKILKGRGRG